MKDFAKLFVHNEVGQVLVTREDNPETDVPGVTIRIPDFGGCEIRVTLSMATNDYDRAESYADTFFASITEENLNGVVAEVIEVRDQMMSSMNDEAHEDVN
jgi:hypothetical protein